MENSRKLRASTWVGFAQSSPDISDLKTGTEPPTVSDL